MIDHVYPAKIAETIADAIDLLNKRERHKKPHYKPSQRNQITP